MLQLMYGALFVIPLILFVVGLVALVFIFWIWMLIDCLSREKFEDKLVWVLVIIFLHVIGAVLYYFIVKNKPNTRRK
jgi:prolipoprotein diacylglyceryltransferase